MGINITIEKKHIYFLAIFVILATVSLVIAQAGGGVVSHSVSEVSGLDPSVADGVDWTEITNKPAGFADGIDNTGSASASVSYYERTGSASTSFYVGWSGGGGCARTLTVPLTTTTNLGVVVPSLDEYFCTINDGEAVRTRLLRFFSNGAQPNPTFYAQIRCDSFCDTCWGIPGCTYDFLASARMTETRVRVS